MRDCFLNISRERYVIVRDNKEIFCGLARRYTFKPFEEIGGKEIKTYTSEKKAISSFNSSWHEEYDEKRYKVVRVMETIKACEQKETIHD